MNVVALFTHPAALATTRGRNIREYADRVRLCCARWKARNSSSAAGKAPKAPLEALGPAHTHVHIDAILALPA